MPPPSRCPLSPVPLRSGSPRAIRGGRKPRHSPSTTEGYSLSLSLFNISSFWNILSGSVGTARRCLSKRHLFQCFTYFSSRLLPLASLNTGLLGDGRSRESDGRGWPTPSAPSAAGESVLATAGPSPVPRAAQPCPVPVQIMDLHIPFVPPKKGTSYSTSKIGAHR